MNYNIEDIQKNMGFRAQLNSFDPEDIRLFKDGKAVHICPEVAKEFTFTGLNTIDFISSKFYEAECMCGECKP